MPNSDTNAYSSEHEAVDLGQQLGEPKVSASGRDIDDATSQSPQAHRHALEDPQMFEPEHGGYLPQPTKTDAVNSDAWKAGARYTPRYEPKGR